jgi:hypothetical protein
MRIGLMTKHMFQHRYEVGYFVWRPVTGFACVALAVSLHAQEAAQLNIQWDRVTAISKSTPRYRWL